MVPKRPTPIDVPPASSSEEETTSSGEEESSSEDEQMQKKGSPSPPQLTQTAKAVKKPDSSAKPESDSDSETESDSESEDVPTSKVKPIASKPMEGTSAKSAKSRSKTSASTVDPGKCTTKRVSEVGKDAKDSKRSKMKDSESNGAFEKSEDTKKPLFQKWVSEVGKDAKDSKRSKMKDSESNGAFEKSEDTKKLLFQRLWSEDDEIVLLKGIIDFIEKKGFDPAKDMNAFYDFIKKSLHFDVALTQLKDKVWRLKKKFENHAKKGKNGEDKTFSKPHDQTTFDLSKKIWGSEGIYGRSKSSTPMSVAPSKIESSVVMEEGEKAERMETEMETHVGSKETAKFDRGVDVASMEDYVIKRGLDMVEGAKKSEMEEKWRKMHVAELELFIKRNELILEQAKLMLAAYKSE
ncbi:GLABROUS1 enhancer-binding protein-like [Euphorbia lathyris]|uniref:GLABROUS1 enhancer-binding protein-like n=1 Tax=Euphorbia lathyris TaxID=212925 RepID=UPI003313B2D0